MSNVRRKVQHVSRACDFRYFPVLLLTLGVLFYSVCAINDSWEGVILPSSAAFLSWAVGEDGVILFSHNYGLDWQSQHLAAGTHLSSVWASGDGSQALVVGDGLIIRFEKSSGLWQENRGVTNARLNGVFGSSDGAR